MSQAHSEKMKRQWADTVYRKKMLKRLKKGKGIAPFKLRLLEKRITMLVNKLVDIHLMLLKEEKQDFRLTRIGNHIYNSLVCLGYAKSGVETLTDYRNKEKGK